MTGTFHLDLTTEMLEGATLAIVPGDPARPALIAEHLERPRPLASNREFTSWLGYLGDVPIVICSTGIGGPSTSIAGEELVRLDGASQHFAPLEYPAASSFECTKALADAAAASGFPAHVGITASSDTFYPGQERYDTVNGRVVARFRGSAAEWESPGVLNYEMESATLFTMCSSQGWRAGCVAGVLVNRHQQETPNPETMELAEKRAVSVVIDAARLLVTQEE